MNLNTSNRGFTNILHKSSQHPPQLEISTHLIGESSAIGDCEDGTDRPGSSYLWFGNEHHLNREEVRELVEHLNRWIETGTLRVTEATP